MKKVLRWLGIILAGIFGLVILGVIGLLVYGQVKFKPKHNDRPLYPIAADTTSAGLARGEYLVHNVMACEDCHAGGQGKWPLAGYSTEIKQGPVQAVFSVPNLTPDAETGLGNWTDAEIARAIREGVDKDGIELLQMPSYNFNVLSDADIAAIIGYLRSLEPVRNVLPALQVNAVGKTMIALGLMGDPSIQQPITLAQDQPAPGTPEYGEYLVHLASCRDCHGESLAGGAVPFSGPDIPPAPDLTSNSEISMWSDAEFLQAIRVGVTPLGRSLNDVMPWRVYGRMSDTDLLAIFHYLRSLSTETAQK